MNQLKRFAIAAAFAAAMGFVSLSAQTAPAGTGDGNGGTKPPVVTPPLAPTTAPARPAQPAPSPTPTPASKKPPVRRG